MSNTANYTAKLKENLYNCIEVCKQAIEICNATKEHDQPSLASDERQKTVDACNACIEACRKVNNSASVYLAHAKETDSIAIVHDAVKKSNICITNCTQIIASCDHINKRCPDIIEACINTLQECIDACRKCAEYKDL